MGVQCTYISCWSSMLWGWHIYSETCLERPLPWETTDHLSWKTTIFWQKDLHFNITEPVSRDHLFWQTTFLWPMGWSFKTGSTVCDICWYLPRTRQSLHKQASIIESLKVGTSSMAYMSLKPVFPKLFFVKVDFRSDVLCFRCLWSPSSWSGVWGTWISREACWMRRLNITQIFLR